MDATSFEQGKGGTLIAHLRRQLGTRVGFGASVADVHYFHVAPARDCVDIDAANDALGLAVLTLSKNQRCQTLSFNEREGRMYLGRITAGDVVILFYPLFWLAEQMGRTCQYPVPALHIAKDDFVGAPRGPRFHRGPDGICVL